MRENGTDGPEALKSRKQTKILFLLRTYNDIDHISPIIWKSATAGCHVFFVFVGRDYSDDFLEVGWWYPKKIFTTL